MSRIRKAIAGPVRRALGDFLDSRLELAAATSPATKAALRQLFGEYRAAIAASRPLPPVTETGFRVFSEVDEDGVILFLLAAAGLDRGRFVDIGAGDCVSASNCANLALNLGFHGLFVEADPERIEAGRRFYARRPDTRTHPPLTVQSFVSRENVDDVIAGAGFDGEIDVLSIDIDGNDFWVWEAISAVTPRIVVVETHPEHGLEDVCAPYRPDFEWRRAAAGEPVGASPAAMVRLGERLGYRLVGGNRFGFNACFLRDDLAADIVPAIGVEELLRHDWSRPSGAGPAPDR
ncbi:MAG TPA: hypothetical protein VNM42_04295 [Solirubrobacterales bacterium]|jgi:hypothetical protein|nr:hypothetical protein [Solirubrobacterales bacterium]